MKFDLLDNETPIAGVSAFLLQTSNFLKRIQRQMYFWLWEQRKWGNNTSKQTKFSIICLLFLWDLILWPQRKGYFTWLWINYICKSSHTDKSNYVQDVRQANVHRWQLCIGSLTVHKNSHKMIPNHLEKNLRSQSHSSEYSLVISGKSHASCGLGEISTRLLPQSFFTENKKRVCIFKSDNESCPSDREVG